jgi:hypothetical protein
MAAMRWVARMKAKLFSSHLITRAASLSKSDNFKDTPHYYYSPSAHAMRQR